MDLVEAVVQVHFKLKVLILNLVNLFFLTDLGFHTFYLRILDLGHFVPLAIFQFSLKLLHV